MTALEAFTWDAERKRLFDVFQLRLKAKLRNTFKRYVLGNERLKSIKKCYNFFFLRCLQVGEIFKHVIGNHETDAN